MIKSSGAMVRYRNSLLMKPCRTFTWPTNGDAGNKTVIDTLEMIEKECVHSNQKDMISKQPTNSTKKLQNWLDKISSRDKQSDSRFESLSTGVFFRQNEEWMSKYTEAKIISEEHNQWLEFNLYQKKWKLR
jgi:hypothetical protein